MWRSLEYPKTFPCDLKVSEVTTRINRDLSDLTSGSGIAGHRWLSEWYDQWTLRSDPMEREKFS